MTANYLVTKEETCWKCMGAGVVQHPMWAQYWAHFCVQGTRNTSEQDRAWFQEQGWDEDLPGEEETCPECEGAKKIVSQIPLAEALKEIGTMVNHAQVHVAYPFTPDDLCFINPKTKVCKPLAGFIQRWSQAAGCDQ